MKYFLLIWAGLNRNAARTGLTVASIAVAFLLYGLLQGINQGMSTVYRDLNVERLYVQNTVDVANGLPLAYLQRIAAVPHVAAVTYTTYFGGFFRDAQHALPMFATDVATLMKIYKDLKLPEDQLAGMLRTRSGVLIGKDIAEQYGWKVGDRVPIGSSAWTNIDGGSTWQFDVAGILDASAYGPGFASVYINQSYFDEARALGSGLVHYYVVSIDDPRRGDEVSTAIDAMFANSGHETKTQSEQAWAQAQIKQAADINFIVNAIVGAVMFALLFLTANTMMQSMRERIPELAVLKTLGYSNAKVLVLVLLESVVLCMSAALLGLLIALILFAGMSSLFGNLSLPFIVLESGFGIALALALVSGFPPAWRAGRLNIVDALAGR